MRGTGVAGRRKPAEEDDNRISSTSSGLGNPPPLVPQLRSTQSLGGGKGAVPTLRRSEEGHCGRALGVGGLRHRVPARCGPSGKGGGADPGRPGPSPAAEAGPSIPTWGGGARSPHLWSCRARSPPLPRLEPLRDPQGIPAPQVCRPRCPSLCLCSPLSGLPACVLVLVSGTPARTGHRGWRGGLGGSPGGR